MNIMEQLKGKACRLSLSINGSFLQYTVKEIIDVTKTHITFKDKYDAIYMYNITNIVKLEDIENMGVRQGRTGGCKK